MRRDKMLINNQKRAEQKRRLQKLKATEIKVSLEQNRDTGNFTITDKFKYFINLFNEKKIRNKEAKSSTHGYYQFSRTIDEVNIIFLFYKFIVMIKVTYALPY